MIVVFGTVCLDRVRRLPHLPPRGGYVEVLEETTVLGGEAANTALTLQAWGDSPILASHPLGDDGEGFDLRNRVRSTGIDLRELRSPRRSEAPVCDVLVTPDGERTMIGRGFSALDRSIDLSNLPVGKGGLFTADANVEDASRVALRRAQAAGMRTYAMDFLRAQEPLVPGSYWQTSTDWAGAPGEIDRNHSVVREMAARTGAYCILTDGANGLYAAGPNRAARHYPPFKPVARIDTTGAGDAFRAGMLHALSRGWDLQVCLQFASAVGALAVGYAGASARIPSLGDVAALIAAQPEVVVAYA